MTAALTNVRTNAYQPTAAPSDGADGLQTGLKIGGAIATAAGLGTAGYAVYAQRDLPDRRQAVVAAEQGLADARGGVTTAQATLAADRVHPPAGTSADEALAWARQRFDPESAITAFTREGDARDVQIGRWGTPTTSSGEALDTALIHADGRAGGVVRAGEWHIPARLTDDLDALEKTRQVSYTETEWGYHHGRNPANGKYEYHYGPHPVTKYRTERYLDPFNEFRSAHDGFDVAFTDDRARLRLRGTRPELALEKANRAAATAADHLDDARRAVKFSESRAIPVRNAGIGIAVLGTAVLGYGLLTRD
jgi:hypothetical protein